MIFIFLFKIRFLVIILVIWFNLYIQNKNTKGTPWNNILTTPTTLKELPKPQNKTKTPNRHIKFYMNKRYFVTYFHGIKHRSLGSHLTLGGHALVRLPLFTEWMTLSKLILTTYKNKILHPGQISQQNDLYQINKLTSDMSSVFFILDLPHKSLETRAMPVDSPRTHL